MGTINYLHKNATKVYEILPTYTDTDTGEEFSRDCQDFEWLFDDIREDMTNNGYEAADDYGDNLRDFSAQNLAKKKETYWLTKSWLTAFRVTKVLQVRSGYYCGANLDYDIIIELDGGYTGAQNITDYDSDEDAINDQIDGLCDCYPNLRGCGWNAGTVEMLRPLLFRKMQSIINEARTELEQLCADYCEETPAACCW